MVGFTNQETINIDRKLSAGVIDGNSTGQWYDSKVANVPSVFNKNILTQFDSVPPAATKAAAQANALAAPTLISDFSQNASAVRLTLVTGTVNTTYLATSSYGSYGEAVRLRNWIHPTRVPLATGLPSVGYSIRVFQGNPASGGTEVLTSTAQSGTGDAVTPAWVFNYDQGILLIAEGYKSTLTNPHILGFRYIGNSLAETLAGLGGGNQAEVNLIEASVGLNSDGSYTAPTGTTYLGASTSLLDGEKKLDTAITNAVSNLAGQIAAIPAGAKGDTGENGKSAYEIALSNGYIGTEASWLVSIKGISGIDGVDGKSAYQIASANGFTGSELEWVSSLKGSDGKDGSAGNDGASGKDGISAYQAAVSLGFIGSEAAWISSLAGVNGTNGINGLPGKDGADGKDGLAGVDGRSAYDIAIAAGFIGTEAIWLSTLKGADGLNGKDGVVGIDGASAYDIALSQGFVGTKLEWITSLKGSDGLKGVDGKDGTNGTNGIDGNVGKDGVNGLSAYAIALTKGFIGTESEWLDSLKGDMGLKGSDGSSGLDGKNGLSAYELAVQQGFIGTISEWLVTLKGANGTVDTTLLDNEIAERTQNDKALQQGLGSEIASRIIADTSLAMQVIATNTAIVDETAARKVSEQAIKDSVDAERSARIAADLALQALSQSGGGIVIQSTTITLTSGTTQVIDSVSTNTYLGATWDIIIESSDDRTRKFTISSLFKKLSSTVSYTRYGGIGDSIKYDYKAVYDSQDHLIKLEITNKEDIPIKVAVLRYPMKVE